MRVSRSRARSTYREYRVIPNAQMPIIINEDLGHTPHTPRLATKQELMQMNMFVLYVGNSNTLVEVHGYLNREKRCCVDVNNLPWPGTHLVGRSGLYRPRRMPLIIENLLKYKGGDNNGKRALLDTKLPEESNHPSTDSEGNNIIIPAINTSKLTILGLLPLYRLNKRLPRVMGDR